MAQSRNAIGILIIPKLSFTKELELQLLDHVSLEFGIRREILNIHRKSYETKYFC